jgi:hypothetical protein
MKQKNNRVMRGASGALGDELVFRQRAGKTVISVPQLPRLDNPTEKQKAVRIKFEAASQYATTAIANADLKEAYQAKAKRGMSAYNVALTDFFKAPVVTGIDISNYSGSPGDTIQVLATDDFKVQAVRVSILNAAGAIVEEGAAIAAPDANDRWIYTATTANAAAAGGKVSVQASDLPGNVTTAEQALEA